MNILNKKPIPGVTIVTTDAENTTIKPNGTSAYYAYVEIEGNDYQRNNYYLGLQIDGRHLDVLIGALEAEKARLEHQQQLINQEG